MLPGNDSLRAGPFPFRIASSLPTNGMTCPERGSGLRPACGVPGVGGAGVKGASPVTPTSTHSDTDK